MKTPGREYCRDCGGLFSLGKLSNRGFCQHCGRDRLLNALNQLRNKTGPIYEKWKKHYLLSLQHVERKLQHEQGRRSNHTN